MPSSPTDRTRNRAVAGLAGLALCALASSPAPRGSAALAALGRLLRGDAGIGAASAGRSAFSAAELALVVAGAGGLVALIVWRAVLTARMKDGAPHAREKPKEKGGAFALAALVIFLATAFYALFRAVPVIDGSFERSGASAGEGRNGAPVSQAVSSWDGVEDQVDEGEDGKRGPALLVGGFLALAAAGALLLRARGTVEAPPSAGPTDDAPPEPGKIAELARTLERGGSARESIIACYGAMCELFGDAARRTRGERALTAREFATLLGRRGIARPEVSALTAVFEKARYSGEFCGETERREALAALEAIERGARSDMVPERRDA
ncbi:MAG: DUF4129 domain-containing protein [Spirochaetales bacterium]|nr:DUF4129 domain-containing protein [Spirochaetales bacterium]